MLRAPEEGAGLSAWQQSLRGVVSRLAAVEPAPLEVVRQRDAVVASLHRTDLLIRGTHRPDFRATVLRPATAAAPLPAVLVNMGHNATLDRVTGAVAPDFPDRDMAGHLARAGFVTLTLDHGLAGAEERPPSDGARGAADVAALVAAFHLMGTSLLGSLVGEALAGLAWLREHPAVDEARVGVFGHSLGGAVALHTALLSGEPVPVSTASHLGTYPMLYGELRTGDPAAVLPGILHYADLPDLYACLAPAPLQVQYGLLDHLLDPADADAAGERVAATYRLLDADDRVEVFTRRAGHGTCPAATVRFFRRHLVAPAPPPAPVPAQRVRFTVRERREILDGVDSALSSGLLSQGPVLAQFESMARAWLGGDVAAVGSGTGALEIAMRIAAVAGGTVLTLANTFFATAATAVRCGARVDFVDLEPDGLGMDPDDLRSRLKRPGEVAAVVPVHIGGVVSPGIVGVVEECRQRGVPVIEDAAHAFGSRLHGRPAGGFGRFGAFSFFATKVLTTCEGGLVTGSSRADLDLVRRLRDHGRTEPGGTLHDHAGGNWRMSEPHASVGVVGLRRFAEVLAERRRLAAWYDANLVTVPGLRPYRPPPETASNYYKYVALLPEGVDRAALKERLRRRHGVTLPGEVYDLPLPQQPFFGAAFVGRGFPRAESFARRHVCLPLYPSLSEPERRRVLEALRAELS